jgi:hypothetical protein
MSNTASVSDYQFEYQPLPQSASQLSIVDEQQPLVELLELSNNNNNAQQQQKVQQLQQEQKQLESTEQILSDNSNKNNNNNNNTIQIASKPLVDSIASSQKDLTHFDKSVKYLKYINISSDISMAIGGLPILIGCILQIISNGDSRYHLASGILFICGDSFFVIGALLKFIYNIWSTWIQFYDSVTHIIVRYFNNLNTMIGSCLFVCGASLFTAQKSIPANVVWDIGTFFFLLGAVCALILCFADLILSYRNGALQKKKDNIYSKNHYGLMTDKQFRALMFFIGSAMNCVGSVCVGIGTPMLSVQPFTYNRREFVVEGNSLWIVASACLIMCIPFNAIAQR